MQFNGLLLLGEMGRGLMENFIRELIAIILSLFYGMIGIILEVVFSVAQLENTEMLREMYSGIQERFYVIIGVVMLFKVTISLITYFANPDKITDKEMGATKMVTRVVTVLILLIFIPQYVFPKLTEIQVPLLSTLGKVVLNSDKALDVNRVHSDGQTIASTIYGSFFQLRDGCSGDADVHANILHQAVDLAVEPCSSDNKKEYKYEFNFIGAIVSIIPILVLLVIIGIQVAIRAFKLIILKLIAPIPIISYIDPKSMKDGGRTSAYMKLFITTYIDLFIHFGTLYFAVLIMQKISSLSFIDLAGGAIQLLKETKVFGMVFVIIGALLFAFQAPKFIKKALGLKDSEFGSGLAGILTTGAVAAGAVGSGVAAFGASAAKGGHLLQNVGAGISSAIRGGQAGYKAAGDKSDYAKVLSGIRAKNAEMAADRAAGITFEHRGRELLESMVLGQGPGARAAAQVEGWDQTTKAFKDMKSALDSEATKGKYGTVRTNKVAGYDWIYGKSKDFAGQASVAKSQGAESFTYQYIDERGVQHDQLIQTKDADWIQSELAKAETEKLYDLLTGNIDPANEAEIEYRQFQNGAINDNPDLVGLTQQLEKVFNMNEVNQVVGGDMEQHFKALSDQMKMVERKSIDTKNSAEYMAAQAAAKKNK